jgi:hypothetical protein
MTQMLPFSTRVHFTLREAIGGRSELSEQQAPRAFSTIIKDDGIAEVPSRLRSSDGPHRTSGHRNLIGEDAAIFEAVHGLDVPTEVRGSDFADR